MDLCLIEDQPPELDESSTRQDRKYHKEWHNSNRKANNIIKITMPDAVRGSIEEPDIAWEFLEAIAEKYLESDKAGVARPYRKFNEMSYSGKGLVRAYYDYDRNQC